MKIAIVSIGDELLRGQTVNTNAAFMSQHLAQEGYRTHQQITLPDERQGLLQGLQVALDAFDLIITTGGLGPTLDDVTREVVAELFGCKMRVDQSIAKDLTKRYLDRYSAVEDQASIPEKALTLPNSVGSAPGLVFEEKGKLVILLPGVPQEMRPLFLDQVLPLIKKKIPSSHKNREVLDFCLLYESFVDPYLRELSVKYPQVEVGIYPSSATLRIVLASSGKKVVQAYKQDLLFKWEQYNYEASSGQIAQALYETAQKQGKTVVFAESCTGGNLAASVTSIPGSSDYFLGSFITYSNALKTSVLGVKPETLSSHGAVSEQTVREMAEGALRLSQADYAIAVSGIAGPSGGSSEKPVGTVWAAIAQRGEQIEAGRFFVTGDRKKIMYATAQYLIGALWRKIEKGVPPFPFLVP